VSREKDKFKKLIFSFGLLFFSQNGMTLKKPTKIIQIR
jgi:hypothetical protein